MRKRCCHYAHQGKPYQLEVRAIAGDTKVFFAGTLVPFLLETMDGNLQLSGKDLSKLYPIVPLPLPWTPAYRLSGRFVREGGIWSFKNFQGKVGGSDMEGDVSLDRKGKRPFITADVKSRRLDYKDLVGFLRCPTQGGRKAATAGSGAEPLSAPRQRKSFLRSLTI